MELKVCGYCNENASYECPCTFPYIFVCKNNLDMHLSLPGNHIIKKLEISGILPKCQIKN